MLGLTIGNYRLVSVIGEGGMGTVFLAEHPEIGRRVAVKLLRADIALDDTAAARFLTEARAASAIAHPNIVQVLDFGRLDDGGPYIIMEFLEGESLAARLNRIGRIPVTSTVEIAQQIATALTAAHRRNVIHRDLKPDNLFLVVDPQTPGREQVKVLDFGIAKDHGFRNSSLRTRTGSLLGTPVYMSPEQCRGTRDPDQRTDIYSFGVILYHMLAGAPPFMSEGLGELIHMHMNVAPEPLRTRHLEIPEHIDRVVLKALAKRPEDRFATAADLQRALVERPAPDAAATRLATSKTIAATATPVPQVPQVRADSGRTPRPVIEPGSGPVRRLSGEHPRQPPRAQAELRFTSWTVFKLVYNANISKGGMNIELGEAPKVGSAVRISLVLPDGPPIELDAIVKNVAVLQAAAGKSFQARYQVGVDLENLDRERKAVIEAAIRKHANDGW